MRPDWLTDLFPKIKPAVDASIYEGESIANNYDFVDMVLMLLTLLNPIFLFRREALYFSIAPVEL